MPYQHSIIVKIPLADFIKVYRDRETFKDWHPHLIEVEQLSGRLDAFGSKLKLTYQMGRRKLEMIETIDKNELPHTFYATYYTEGLDLKQENTFRETTEGYTHWTQLNELLPLNFTTRFYTWFFKSTFKKQSKMYMKNLKRFIENKSKA